MYDYDAEIEKIIKLNHSELLMVWNESAHNKLSGDGYRLFSMCGPNSGRVGCPSMIKSDDYYHAFTPTLTEFIRSLPLPSDWLSGIPFRDKWVMMNENERRQMLQVFKTAQLETEKVMEGVN